MDLKGLFDGWLDHAGKKYANKQWLLSKWEVCEGVEWSQDKIETMVKSIERGLELRKDSALVDLGCGGGWVLERLRRQVKDCVGLDFCWSMLENAKITSPQSRFVQGAIGRLPFKDESFDRALCYFVLINMTDDAAVKESIIDILRVVKKGGRVLIGQLPDAAGSSEYDKAKGRHLEYCRKRYKLGDSIRDICYMPQKLFHLDQLKTFLNALNVRYEILPSFNPFYRTGEPETVSWRFDLVLEKV